MLKMPLNFNTFCNFVKNNKKVFYLLKSWKKWMKIYHVYKFVWFGEFLTIFSVDLSDAKLATLSWALTLLENHASQVRLQKSLWYFIREICMFAHGVENNFKKYNFQKFIQIRAFSCFSEKIRIIKNDQWKKKEN